MYDFSILKVMAVCINATRANAIFSALARYGFFSSRFCQKYGLPNSLLALTHKSSHILIPEMPDSIKFQ